MTSKARQLADLGGDTANLEDISSAYTGGALSNRNLIINGAMQVAQRGTSTSTINSYLVDRWRSFGGALTHTMSQQDVLSSLGTSKYALRMQRDSGATETNNTGFAQGIESANCYGLAGTTVTLSFKARKGADLSSSMVSAILFGTGVDQNPVGMTGQTSSSATQTLSTDWTYFTQTVSVPSGTTQMTVAFSWTPSGTAGANDWFEVAEVQLEKGSAATPFEHRSYGQELALCQRYFQGGSSTELQRSVGMTGGGSLVTSTLVMAPHSFSPKMRSTPTLAYNNIVTCTGQSCFTVTAMGLSSATPHGVMISMNGSFSGTAVETNFPYILTNSGGGYVYFDAEL